MESIYKMSEIDLRAYARECGLHNGCIDTLVRRVIYDEQWSVIAKQLGYSMQGIMKHRQTILKKLGVAKI